MSTSSQEASFERLRSLIERPELTAEELGTLWALAEDARARFPAPYRETWLPALRSASRHTDARILRWFEFSRDVLWEASEAPDVASSARILEAGLEPYDDARALFPHAHFGLRFPMQSIGEGAHEDPEELMPLLGARELWGLDVSGNAGVQVWMVRTMGSLPHLRYLNLDGCEVDDRDVHALIEGEFFRARSLEFLSIGYPWFGMDGFRALAAAPCLQSVKVLRVDVHEQELSFEEMAELFAASSTFSGELRSPGGPDEASSRGRFEAAMDEAAYQAARRALA